MLMYWSIHCAFCAPASLNLPSLATLFRGFHTLKRFAALHPILRFALIGGVLFVAQRALSPAAAPEPITVDAAWLARVQADWRAVAGSAPSAVELRAAVEAAVDEERLLRAALAAGLDRGDPVVRQHLIRNMRFAFPDSRRSDDDLLREARALGMSQHDPVVRRRLVQRMADRLVETPVVPHAALETYVEAHADRYARSARYDIEQHYFETVEAAAQARRRVLDDQPAPAGLGQPFLLGTQLTAVSPAQLRQRFGEAFAERVLGAAPGRWQGPVASAYGWHLLRVIDHRPPQPPALAPVRRQAAYAWLAARQPEALRAAMAPLRQHYPLQLDPQLAVPW